MKKDYIDISRIRQLCREACQHVCAEEGIPETDVQVDISAPSAGMTRAMKIEVVERPQKVIKGSRNWQDN